MSENVHRPMHGLGSAQKAAKLHVEIVNSLTKKREVSLDKIKKKEEVYEILCRRKKHIIVKN